MNEFEDPELSTGEVKEEQAPAEVYEIPYVLELKRPIKVSEKITRESITFKREADVGMMKHLPLNSTSADAVKIGHALPIISAMTGEPSAVIEKLSHPDFVRCIRVLESFL